MQTSRVLKWNALAIRTLLANSLPRLHIYVKKFSENSVTCGCKRSIHICFNTENILSDGVCPFVSVFTAQYWSDLDLCGQGYNTYGV